MSNDPNRPSHGLLQRIRSAPVPDRLYHYTSQSGCVGIFSTQCVWATSVRFFNDEREFHLAHDLAFDYLTELEGTSSYEESGFFHRLREQFAITAAETFVASFSVHGDLLSQWRGYAASGYSLGFSGAALASVAADSLLLAPCVYNERHQVGLIQEYADATAEYYRELRRTGCDEGTAAQMAVEEFQTVLGFLAPIIKHSSFSEESEWRLIGTRIGANSGRLRFRPGRSMVTPYVELPLRSDGDVLRLEEVVVGPTPHPETAALAIAMLQLHTGVGVGEVRASSIPYRDW